MAAAETARLIASLELKDKMSAGVKSATKGIDKLDKKWDKVKGKVGKGLAIGVAGAAAFTGVQIKAGLENLATLEDATTSVDAAIKQTGQTGKVTSQQIADWANDIERDVGAAFDDKAIVQAATTLLRFGKVTTENLRPSLQVITDLATKTGSVESAATLLAKALADPEKAAGKLARTGVILTKEEQKQIKAFVKAGKVGKAQKVVLDALTKSTKGAAAASQGPYRRALSVLADVTEDAQKALATGFLPVLEKAADLLSTELAKPGTLKNIKAFGDTLASGLDAAIELVRKVPWGTIGDSLRIAGMGAKAVFDAFTSLPPWVQTAVLTGWGLNKLSGGILTDVIGELGKGLVKGVLGMNAGVVNINAGVVNGVGGGAADIAGKVGGAAAGASGAAGGIGIAALATTVAALVAAPAVIAAVGLAIRDQTGAAAARGKAETASARHIPDANNKALRELNRITGTVKKLPSAVEVGLAMLGPAIRKAILNKQGAGVGAEVGGFKGTDKTSAKRENDRIVTTLGGKTDKLRTDSASWLSKNHTAAMQVRDTVSRGSTVQASATRAGAATVAGAVRSSRPIVTTNVDVHVTAASVSKSVTQQTRYGPGNGSAGGGGPKSGGARRP